MACSNNLLKHKSTKLFLFVSIWLYTLILQSAENFKFQTLTAELKIKKLKIIIRHWGAELHPNYCLQTIIMLILNELLLTQNNIDTQTCLEFITSAKATEMCFKSPVQQVLVHDKILEFLARSIWVSKVPLVPKLNFFQESSKEWYYPFLLGWC